MPYFFSMVTKSKVINIAIFGLVLIIIGALVFASLNQFATSPNQLYPQEIREYQGKDLSSIGDFRENSIKGPQEVDLSAYSLKITGLVNQELEYSYQEILDHQIYQKVVTLFCVEGWKVDILWEGILLKDLFQETGIGSSAKAVIFTAADGYTTSLPLDFILEKNILIAYKMNNVTLPKERGFPFQLVAESQYGYKWIKWITQIELSDNVDYRGFWESRGYPNNATLR